jgi:polysaccharide biosynthesis transport protein
MSFSEFLSVIAARWKLTALLALAVVAAGIWLAQVVPHRYVASASMLIEMGKAADPIGRGGLIGLEQKAYMATQVQVLGSERVARAVGKSLSPEHTAAFRQTWAETGHRGDFDAWLASELLRNVSILPSRESNVVAVRFRAESPHVAASVANAFIAQYMATAVDLRVQSAQQYLGFFQQQAEDHRLTLEKARAALTRFNQSRGILGADDRQDVESARLAELSREITVLEAQLAESAGRDAQARTRAAQMREVTTDPVIIAMRTDLQRSRTALSEAQQALGENHPRIVELRQSINDQVDRLERETARVTAGLGVERNVLTQRLAAARSAMREQRDRVAQLSEARSEASVLIADVESAQRAYDSVINGLQQIRLESQATQGNATLLEEAVPPLRQSMPNLPLILAVAAFLGTLLGILAGLVRELFDRRIRTDVQLATLAGQPLLCTVPSFSGSKGKRLRISTRRALGGKLRRLPAA